MCVECFNLASSRVKRGATEEYRCCECGELRLAREFHTKTLDNLVLEDKLYEAKRLRCDPSQLERFAKELCPCCACKKNLPKEQFSLARAKSHRTTQRRCELCERPPCKVCGQRPAKPLTNQNEVIKSLADRRAYRCQACKYPPCDVCKTTPRPDPRNKVSVDNLPKWICSRCRDSTRKK